MMKFRLLGIAFILTFLGQGLSAQEQMVAVTINETEHGSLVFDPPLSENGEVPAGTALQVSAVADPGYVLDSIYTAVGGIFGVQYLEFTAETATFVAGPGINIGALFLPESGFEGFSVRQDIVYAQPGVKALDYDVWTPDGADNLPIIVIIHGGGWRANTEDIMRGMAREMVRSGKYVVVSIDYRWIGTADGDADPNTMDDLVNDVFGAIAHIQEHAQVYGGDASRIAVTGDSAGAHLAAVAAMMPDKIGDGGYGETEGVFEFLPSYVPAGKSLARVREDITAAIMAAAPSYGIFSDERLGGGPGLQYAAGQSSDPAFSKAIAPIHFIPEADERAVPHYLTRGTFDSLINDAMVTSYVQALAARHQRVRYDQVPKANHAFFDWKPDQETRDVFARFGVPYVHEMVKFFDSVFYPE